ESALDLSRKYSTGKWLIGTSRSCTTTQEQPPAGWQNKRGYSAEFPQERFFTPAALLRRSSAAVNVYWPSCRIRASATSARSCGLEMLGPGALCVSLTPRSLDEVFSSDLSGADCVEVRLDYLNNPQDSLTARWDRIPLPVIATCRGKERG